jgi:hypothetical protein
VNSPRQARAFGKHHNLRAFAALGLAHARPPFFAGENVPSAKDSSVRTLPALWSFRSSRDQALARIPLLNHSLNRRQQVVGEGKHLGRSFQRAPVRRTQQIPSKQRRASQAGRPPLGEGLGVGNRSEINAHCLSVNSRFGKRSRPMPLLLAVILRLWDMSDLLTSVPVTSTPQHTEPV